MMAVLCSLIGSSFPDSSVGKESACNVGDLGSVPGLGRSPGARERLPTPVFWPGEFHELYSPWGHKKSDMTELLSLTHWMEIGIIFSILSFERH